MTQTSLNKYLRYGLGLYLPLLAVLVWLLFPLYWMITTSLKFQNEILNFAVNPLWVNNPSLGNYNFLFTADLFLSQTQQPLFLRWYLNSALVAVATTAVSLLISVMAGYAIARLRFRGATLAGVLIFITYLVPKSFLFVPLAEVLSQIGVYGNFSSLLLTYPTFQIPFCTWLLSGYFRNLPAEPEECAMVDGCSRLGAVVRITLPVAVPGILTAGIFAFTQAWNEVLYAVIFIGSELDRTLPGATIGRLVQADNYHWGPLMAAGVLGTIPVALLYFTFMDYYVGGLTAGAVKG